MDTTRGRYRLERNGTLVIVGVRRDDGGEYTCRADNRLAAPDTRSVTLTVLGELSPLMVVSDGGPWWMMVADGGIIHSLSSL